MELACKKKMTNWFWGLLQGKDMIEGSQVKPGTSLPNLSLIVLITEK